MRVLYGFGSSFAQAEAARRFFAAASPSHEVRFAGPDVHLSSFSVDYTTDACNRFHGGLRNPKYDSDTFRHFLDEITTFNPDLIISDADLFTAHAAITLGRRYWLCTSEILYESIERETRKHFKLFYSFPKLFYEDIDIEYLLKYSSRNLVYSVFADVSGRPPLRSGYEYVRPYYRLRSAESNKHFVATLSKTDKKLINFISKLNDLHLYSRHHYERYYNVIHRNVDDSIMVNDVGNAYFVVSMGETSFIADAFYNGKYSLVYTDVESRDCAANGNMLEHYGIGERLYTRESFEQINDLCDKSLDFKISLNSNVKQLHELL